MRSTVIATLTFAAVISVFACSKKDAPPPPDKASPKASASSAAAPKEDDCCGGTTCDKCLGTAGGTWNTEKKTCRLGLPEGVNPDKALPFVNMPEDCK